MKPSAARQTEEVKQTTHRPWRSRVRSVATIAGYAYLALAACVLASIWLGGDRWWWATVLMFAPRWPWLVPAILVLPVLFALRHRVLPACLFALLAYLLLGVQLPWSAISSSAADGEHFSVVTMNVQGGKISYQAFKRSWPADLDALFLQECQSDSLDKIVPADWNRQVGSAGICLASRHPMSNFEEFPRPHGQGWGDSAIRCVITTELGPVRITAVHLRSPRDGFEALRFKRLGGVKVMNVAINERRKEAVAVSKWMLGWAIESEAPLIIAGDFNTPIESQLYQKYWSTWQNAFGSVGAGTGYTKFTKWHGVRIDHILCDQATEVISCRVGDDYGSDHRPVYAELAFPVRASRNKNRVAQEGVE